MTRQLIIIPLIGMAFSGYTQGATTPTTTYSDQQEHTLESITSDNIYNIRKDGTKLTIKDSKLKGDRAVLSITEGGKVEFQKGEVTCLSDSCQAIFVQAKDYSSAATPNPKTSFISQDLVINSHIGASFQGDNYFGDFSNVTFNAKTYALETNGSNGVGKIKIKDSILNSEKIGINALFGADVDIKDTTINISNQNDKPYAAGISIGGRSSNTGLKTKLSAINTTINTNGNGTPGIESLQYSGAGNGADSTWSASKITTYGTGSHGVYSAGGGNSLKFTDGSIIKTLGEKSSALYTTGSAAIDVNNGTIISEGNESSPLQTIYFGKSSINNQSKIISNGKDSSAIKIAYAGSISIEDSTAEANGINSDAIRSYAASATLPQNSEKYASSIKIKNSNIISKEGYGISAKGGTTFINFDNSQISGKQGLLNNQQYKDIDPNFEQENTHVIIDASNSSRLIGRVITESDTTSDFKLNSNSTWLITGNSNVTNLALNNSQIEFNKANEFNKLTIDGQYTGTDGTITVNTIWNDSKNLPTSVNGSAELTDSLSDLVSISGSASGYTKVQTRHGIIGTVKPKENEQYSADVIKVADSAHSTPNAFYGIANTAGAGQATLVQKDANTYVWQLAKGQSIRPEGSAFISAPQISKELGYGVIGSMHERIGSLHQSQPHEQQKIWGRLFGDMLDVSGENQFDYKSNYYGIQFGSDLHTHRNQEKSYTNTTGVMATYAHNDAKFNDSKSLYFDKSSGEYKTKDSKTGTGENDLFALGLYSGIKYDDDLYLDFVANIDYTKNKYKSEVGNHGSNISHGLTFSAEIGKQYPLNQNNIATGWSIEPQVQLIYQYRKFNDFEKINDYYIAQDDSSAFRGRLGLRLAKRNDSSEEFYIIGNILHDFSGNESEIFFNGDKIKEKYAKTFFEIGAGGQLQVNESSYIYMDSRYRKSLSNNHGNSKGVKFNIGLKHVF